MPYCPGAKGDPRIHFTTPEGGGNVADEADIYVLIGLNNRGTTRSSFLSLRGVKRGR